MRFQSTPPARGATAFLQRWCNCFYISIHAPREGGDHGKHGEAPALWHFNPRPPRGGRRRPATAGTLAARFQSTPPARGGRQSRAGASPLRSTFQSTPREGGDYHFFVRKDGSVYHFNPRPPARGATEVSAGRNSKRIFQSTPPARGATSSPWPTCWNSTPFQSTPPARGATWYAEWLVFAVRQFQSTPPARGATRHADAEPGVLLYFNPRPPRGGRPKLFCITGRKKVFQSTPPARGGDWTTGAECLPPRDYFNPRPPRGGRHRHVALL